MCVCVCVQGREGTGGSRAARLICPSRLPMPVPMFPSPPGPPARGHFSSSSQMWGASAGSQCSMPVQPLPCPCPASRGLSLVRDELSLFCCLACLLQAGVRRAGSRQPHVSVCHLSSTVPLPLPDHYGSNVTWWKGRLEAGEVGGITVKWGHKGGWGKETRQEAELPGGEGHRNSNNITINLEGNNKIRVGGYNNNSKGKWSGKNKFACCLLVHPNNGNHTNKKNKPIRNRNKCKEVRKVQLGKVRENKWEQIKKGNIL